MPTFAFFAAGVALGGLDGGIESLTDRVTLGVTVGLVVGKALDILTATFLTAKLTRAELDTDLSWVDVAGAALLGGIGFTVWPLIGELAFAGQPLREDHVRMNDKSTAPPRRVLDAM